MHAQQPYDFTVLTYGTFYAISTRCFKGRIFTITANFTIVFRIMFARSGEITDVLAGIAYLIAIGGSSKVRRIFTSTAHGAIVLIIVVGGGGGIAEVSTGTAISTGGCTRIY